MQAADGSIPLSRMTDATYAVMRKTSWDFLGDIPTADACMLGTEEREMGKALQDYHEQTM